jgi:hypothetical protein
MTLALSPTHVRSVLHSLLFDRRRSHRAVDRDPATPMRVGGIPNLGGSLLAANREALHTVFSRSSIFQTDHNPSAT